MYKLNFYVPETDIEQVKDALFEKGAGRIGQYDHCCWQTKGEGQFRPLERSNPFIGRKNKIEKVIEYKVEMVCENQIMADVIETLFKVHPYEEPAYEVYRINEIGQD